MEGKSGNLLSPDHMSSIMFSDQLNENGVIYKIYYNWLEFKFEVPLNFGWFSI